MRLKIRELREDNNLTQKQIAKILNTTQQTYSRYESGEITIDIYSLIKLSDYYNTSIDYIVGLTNDFNYKNSKDGIDSKCFIPEYQRLLTINSTNHFTLSKKGLVNESSLSWWKKGGLPKFEVIFNIAYELGGSIDKLLGRI